MDSGPTRWYSLTIVPRAIVTGVDVGGGPIRHSPAGFSLPKRPIEYRLV
jgi:hypothetical protein